MLNWDDLRFFLAIARHGTMSAAAKRLHVTQSTVGRRLAALQNGIGVRLVHRAADRYVLTLAGEAIRPHAERIEAEAMTLEHAVLGQDSRLDGVVRVTSSQMVASHLLAPAFALLHDRTPGITIEALPNMPGNALSAHDVDISVQLTPFEHHDLVVRTIGRIGFGLYASVPYIARCGLPDTRRACAGQLLVTVLDDRLPAQAGWLAEHAAQARVVMKTDSYEMQHWAVLCGGAIALLPRFRGDAEPALRRVQTAPAVPGADIAVAIHRDNRQTPRVRMVLDCIAQAVRSRMSALDPPEIEAARAG